VNLLTRGDRVRERDGRTSGYASVLHRRGRNEGLLVRQCVETARSSAGRRPEWDGQGRTAARSAGPAV